MASILQAENLTKKFRSIQALDGLNLEIARGAVYALVGANGAGKTTAIKIFMNIITPSSGSASVLGYDSRRLSGRAFDSIGYVSENQQLPGWMKVEALLAYMKPFYPTWDDGLEAKLVSDFDLPMGRRLRDLSRGTRMKVALAAALSFRPRLIVLDEPFSGLDPLVRDELSEALVKRTDGTTIFLSSHDLAEIESIATHVGYLESGRLRLSESMASLSARFRQVEVIFENAPGTSAPLPPAWLQVDMSQGSLRFVDSSFDHQQTVQEITSRFGPVKSFDYSPMSLRAIFLALAKAGRGEKSGDAL